jgi:hypothetical protein
MMTPWQRTAANRVPPSAWRASTALAWISRTRSATSPDSAARRTCACASIAADGSNGHLVAIPGEGNGLITRPTSHIDQCRWRLWQMVPKRWQAIT